ncbi:MAG TPA: hypothetical protein VK210_00510, partial [Terriglobia bacterium]|nr:hypothetical protein [Terriglobia bacterium]
GLTDTGCNQEKSQDDEESSHFQISFWGSCGGDPLPSATFSQCTSSACLVLSEPPGWVLMAKSD